MLPVYEAIDILGVINEKVGHTKPWVVLANTPQGLTSFVVKMYNTNQVEFQHCVTKEFICNALAREFDLKVPGCALINIPTELAFSRSAVEQHQFDNTDERPKFATVLLNNVNNAITTLPKNEFSKRIALDTLYAFDNLIRNSDRGNPKTNLLLSPNDAFLIDHEMTFGYDDITNIEIENFQFYDRFTRYHLFYNHLKKAQPKTKQNYFDEFLFYLDILNLRTLNPYFHQLNNEGFSDYSQPILTWLNEIKQKSAIFVNLLKGTVQ